MTLLLDRCGADIHITEEVVKAAAGNWRSGKKVMTLLLDRRGVDVQITEEVIEAAAAVLYPDAGPLHRRKRKRAADEDVSQQLHIQKRQKR